MIRRWDAVTGEPIGNVVMGAPEDPLAAFAAIRRRGVPRLRRLPHAERRRGARAGPTLAGIFGRKIATLPGYNFSDALKKLRHRVDAGDGVEAVRVGAHDLHPRDQDAGSADRLGRGPRRADGISGEDHEGPGERSPK
jgi:hypothetical protein